MTRLMFLALAGLLFGASGALSQDWPSRTVTMIVPFAAGSTPDVAARLVAERLQAKLGQPFVIENRPGASGNTGTGAIARAEPDGYTIGVSIVGPLALNTVLYAKMPYDPKVDIAPVTVLASQPNVLIANKELGLKGPGDLVALLGKDGTKLNFGSIGAGSVSQLSIEMIALKAGARPTHIAFTSSPAVLTAVMRNDVQMAVLAAASVVQQGNAGEVGMLAVTSAKRSPLLPNLPTLAESGIAGVEADSWIGLVAPAKTAPAILSKLEREVRAILAEPDLTEKFRAVYMVPVGNSPQEFRALLDAELNTWAPIIRQNGIKIGQ